MRSALTAAVLLAACGSSYEAQPTQVIFDPASKDFWARPYPSDLRRQDDGSFDLERWPAFAADTPLASTNTLLHDWLTTLDERVRDGFSVSGGVYFKLSGPVDPATLPDPAGSLGDGASVYLVDVDPASPQRGQRIPVHAELRASGDRYAPPNLLAVVPVFGFLRRPSTRYAAVITRDVRDAGGAALGASQAFFDAWEDTGDADAKARENLRALHDFLPEAERERVVGAAVFTTMDPNTRYFDLADWAEALPTPTVRPWRVAETFASYQVLTSTFSVPIIQGGPPPFKNHGEGRIVYGSDGKPEIQRMQDVRVVITIPRRPQPSAGFPLMLYLHGSGGEWYESITRGPQDPSKPRNEQPPPPPGSGPAEWLARRGIGAAGFDFPLHGNRHNPPDTTGLVLYNLFGNADATIDNFTVAAMEPILVSKLLMSLRIDPSIAPSLDAGAAPDGMIRFDPDRFGAMGHSMGQSLGVTFAAADRRIKAFFVSGGGGMLPEIAVNATEPIILRPFVEGAAELPEDQHLDVHHPLLHALQHLWDLVDPVVKAPYLVRSPREGVPIKSVLMTTGYRDGYFAPGAQAALATALGLPLVGDAVEPEVPARLALAGLAPLTYPVQANLPTGATGAVIAYSVPRERGHYVSFDLEPTRYQYTCFFASLAPGAPPRISAPQALEAPCPYSDGPRRGPHSRAR